MRLMHNDKNYFENNKLMENGFVQIRNVTKNYHTPAGDFLALDKIDLKIKEGEFVSIVGKSGSGKSTLINMITGIDHPTSGNVVINGRDIRGQNEGEMALWRGKNMGIVFQFFQLLPMLSVLENTMLPMDFCNQYEFDKREAIALKSVAAAWAARSGKSIAYGNFRRSPAMCCYSQSSGE